LGVLYRIYVFFGGYHDFEGGGCAVVCCAVLFCGVLVGYVKGSVVKKKRTNKSDQLSPRETLISTYRSLIYYLSFPLVLSSAPYVVAKQQHSF
jgi:hypothetical protein